MINELSRYLSNERLLQEDEAVVVGVSGGSDSLALLHLLLGLNRSNAWDLKLHVAHLHHQLRGEEADADAAFVQATCDSLAIPCTIDRRDVRSLSDADGMSVEEVSRRERYTFFERTCLQVGSRVVAVGHQADDNAETVLHRILRGTGLRGLAGIPRSRTLSPGSECRLVRPLLNFTRAELREFLSNAGIAWREDRTNVLNEAMRNRVRNLLIPQIEAEVNPQVREALLRLASQARWLEEFLQETVQRTFETLVVSRTDQSLVLNAEAVARKSRIVQSELVRLAYSSFGLGEQDLAYIHLLAVLDLVSDPTSGRQAQLPGGMTVEKRYHQLIFSMPSDEPRERIAAEIAVHLPGQTHLPLRCLEIDCAIKDVTAGDIPCLRKSASRFEEFLDLASVRPPLIVRSRRPGDRFIPLGAPGTKKVADFLADEKIDPRDREKTAILCDQLGPIWVVGHRIDDRVKLTTLTRKVLHIQARPLER
jgi:tRNA(Ile)-lysidine synthase